MQEHHTHCEAHQGASQFVCSVGTRHHACIYLRISGLLLKKKYYSEITTQYNPFATWITIHVSKNINHLATVSLKDTANSPSLFTTWLSCEPDKCRDKKLLIKSVKFHDLSIIHKINKNY